MHRSGSLTCGTFYDYSRWGCGYDSSVLKTLITDRNKNQLFTDQDQQQVSDWSKQDELVFHDMRQPMHVKAGSEIQIWYDEDLNNYYEIDNAGEHCVDVYTKFVDHV